jgi:gliding motility-associated-like protein
VKHKTAEVTVYVNQCPPITYTDFSISADTICRAHCIYFKDLTYTNASIPLFYEWIFTGGTASSNGGLVTVHSGQGAPDTAFVQITDSTAMPTIKVCYPIANATNQVFDVTELISHGPIGSGAITYTVSHPVKVLPAPVVHASSNVTINLGDSTQISAGTTTGVGGIIGYTWTPADSVHCDGTNSNQCVAPWVQPSQTTQYTVTALDKYGCTNTSTVTVFVDLKCYDPFIPTAFSPNDDGTNDMLFVRSNCLQNFTFRVFDRWGEKVFETTSLNYGWDGTFRSIPVNAGVFVWTLEGFLSNGKEVKKHGSTTLVR